MGKSSRSIKRSRIERTDKKIDRESKIAKINFMNKQKNITLNSRSKFRYLKWGFLATGFLMLLLLSGLFSPNSNPSNNDFIKNEDLPENTFTQENGLKLSVVLYSSPTCGCCHEYVNYLNDNGFDTFQKRTESYRDIKIEKLIPKEQWSCHTAVIGDYFIEGHIPLSVVYDLLSQNPKIDGISLPSMPSGTPGMEGAKNAEWVISSILNGNVIETFARI